LERESDQRFELTTANGKHHILNMKTLNYRSKTSSALARALCALAIVSVGSLAFSATAFADVVVEWNTAMTSYSESLPPPGMPPIVETRIYAMTHIAAWNAIRVDSPHYSKKAAVAQAAHDVLVNQFPDGAAGFDDLLTAQLAAIPDGNRKTRGVQRGAAAAAGMLAKRANDGSATAEGPYAPGTNPGDYQFTPPFDGPPFNGYAAFTKWGLVTPFVMNDVKRFRAPPPYNVRDLEYTYDFIEIKTLGSLNSASRTADQTNLAIFWYENSSFGWNRIARLLAKQQSNTLVEHAHLFATLNAALADAYIASLDSKYLYNFWRPITAIRRAANDGNNLTEADPAWQPLLLTPPVPDYPSAHAAAGGAASAVLISFFGDEHIFTLRSTLPVPPRTFNRISDAAKENSISRMLVGIHFRLACTAGYEQGLSVGQWAVQHVR
jgi:hypothetical protein